MREPRYDLELRCPTCDALLYQSRGVTERGLKRFGPMPPWATAGHTLAVRCRYCDVTWDLHANAAPGGGPELEDRANPGQRHASSIAPYDARAHAAERSVRRDAKQARLEARQAEIDSLPAELRPERPSPPLDTPQPGGQP